MPNIYVYNLVYFKIHFIPCLHFYIATENCEYIVNRVTRVNRINKPLLWIRFIFMNKRITYDICIYAYNIYVMYT